MYPLSPWLKLCGLFPHLKSVWVWADNQVTYSQVFPIKSNTVLKKFPTKQPTWMFTFLFYNMCFLKRSLGAMSKHFQNWILCELSAQF